MPKWVLFCAFLALPAWGKCTDPQKGILLKVSGQFLYEKKPLDPATLPDCIKPGDLNPGTSGTGSFTMLLSNGSRAEYKCDAQGCRASIVPPSPSMDMIARFWAAMSGEPEYRSASSRATGWRDMVVPVPSTTTLDVTNIFLTPHAVSAVRLCPLTGPPVCDAPPRPISWDGTKATYEVGTLQPGIYRLIEGERVSEAWIRVIPPDPNRPDLAAKLQVALRAALDQLRQIPPEDLPESLSSGDGWLNLQHSVLVNVTLP